MIAAPALSATMSRRGPRSPFRTERIGLRRLFDAPDDQVRELRARQAELLRRKFVRRHLAVLQLRRERLARRRDFVEAVVSVDDEASLAAEVPEHGGEDRRQGGVVDADDLVARAGGVGQRAEQVEDGADADLAPRTDGELHRLVEHRRVEEADPGLAQAALDHVRPGLDVHAELLEHVRRAAVRADGAVAVLGDRRARAGGDERRRGRDVERVPRIAAGAAGVEHDLGAGLDAARLRAHDAGAAGDLLRRLALHAQRDDERRDLRRRRLAAHHLVHRLRALFGRQVPPLGQAADRLFNHRRVFSSIRQSAVGIFVRRSLGGADDVDSRRRARLGPVALGDFRGERVDAIRPDERHGASAESRAGHPAAEHAFRLAGDADQQVEFPATRPRNRSAGCRARRPSRRRSRSGRLSSAGARPATTRAFSVTTCLARFAERVRQVVRVRAEHGDRDILVRLHFGKCRLRIMKASSHSSRRRL